MVKIQRIRRKDEGSNRELGTISTWNYRCVERQLHRAGADVLAIVTTDIYKSGVWWLRGLRHRANDTYGESHYYETSTVELHHTWANLPVGTYTLAIQVFVDSNNNVYGVYNTRLTLIIT